MGITFGRPPLSEKELKKVREQRQGLLELARMVEEKIPALVDEKKIDSGGAREALELVRDFRKFVAKNVDMNFDQLQAQVQIRMEDAWKKFIRQTANRTFRNWATYLSKVGEILQSEKRITFKKRGELLNLGTEINSWVRKNGKKAEQADQNDQEKEIFKKLDAIEFDPKDSRKDAQTKEMIRQGLNFTRTLDPDVLASLLDRQDKQAKNTFKTSGVDLDEVSNTFWDTMSKTFGSLILISLCILSGCIAANMAIGRTPAQRVLQFLWGAFPLFMPFIILQAIQERIFHGELRLFAILPLSIEPASTRIGKLLWYPFQWVPDEKSIAKYREFTEGLASAVA